MTPRLLITGSRDWTNQDAIAEALRDWWISTGRDPAATLVSGACPTGADRIAETLWENQGLTVERHPADWKKLGRRAGPARNRTMVESGPDAAAAFIRAGSKGASGTLTMIEKAGIPVRVYREEKRTNDYPLLLERPCCTYKTSCGSTELYLVETHTEEGMRFGYNRITNSDDYFGPATAEATVEFLATEGPKPWR